MAVELWRAQVPLKIKVQLQMSASTLKRQLAHAREHPDLPVKPQKMGTGMKNSKLMDSTLRDMRKHLLRNPTLTAKRLKGLLPALENISIRTIQRLCLMKLKLLSRKMAPKPLLKPQTSTPLRMPGPG